ncbi:Guanylate kinase [Candidatus Erwinia haradaeae]|uniref:Guanylate kinase n=1 Tax=Candidatus Erwinia haradaeae TaxID=1922217 RepID=A0A451DLS8_9GAMM|nr:guanylate kinase [Candidatus Erwinia haradaeae]VFP87679.1 Guanylate kinase [Candidatus Erwinia haradaeae]
MTPGTLFIISAPSGAGKSSLIKALCKTQALCNTQISISHTTRKIRPGENNGEHYYFVNDNQFRNMIYEKKFLEYAKVFGNYYGTSRQSIIKGLQKGIDIFLDIDWQGARRIRRIMPTSRSIFIVPPSKDELKRRLYKREQDSTTVIAQRMTQVIAEIKHYKEYHYLIVNENFDRALIDLQAIIRSERLRVRHQAVHHYSLIHKLLEDECKHNTITN